MLTFVGSITAFVGAILLAYVGAKIILSLAGTLADFTYGPLNLTLALLSFVGRRLRSS